MTKVTDEQLIAGLLQYGSIRATAAALHTGESTIYARMKNGEFKEQYLQARADLLRDAVQEIAQQRKIALQVISDVMQDKETNPATRLQAAQTIINSEGKYLQQLQEAEKAVMIQHNANTPWSAML